MKPHTKNIMIISILIFFLFDRFLKYLAMTGYSTKIFGDFFQFNFAPNYFISFSLPLSGPILTFGIALILATLIFALAKRILTKNIDLTFILIVGVIAGGISNLIDRLRYNFVIDYLDLEYFTVFNIADAMIVISVIFLIMLYRRKDHAESAHDTFRL